MMLVPQILVHYSSLIAKASLCCFLSNSNKVLESDCLILTWECSETEEHAHRISVSAETVKYYQV